MRMYTTCKYCNSLILEEHTSCSVCGHVLRFTSCKLLEILKHKVNYAFLFNVNFSTQLNSTYDYGKTIIKFALLFSFLQLALLVAFNYQIDIPIHNLYENYIGRIDEYPDAKDISFIPNILFSFFLIMSTLNIIIGSTFTLLFFTGKIIKHIFTGKQVVISELLASSARIFLPPLTIDIDSKIHSYIHIFDPKDTGKIQSEIIDFVCTENNYLILDKNKEELSLIQSRLSESINDIENIKIFSKERIASFLVLLVISLPISLAIGAIFFIPTMLFFSSNMVTQNFHSQMHEIQYLSPFAPIISSIYFVFIYQIYVEIKFFLQKKDKIDLLLKLKKQIDEIDERISIEIANKS